METDPKYQIEKLVENFQFLGHNPTDEILAKCLELCTIHDINEEDFVDIWAAFSISNWNNAAPCLSGLELLERKSLAKMKATGKVSTQATPKKTKEVKAASTPTTPKVQQSYSEDISKSQTSQLPSYSSRQNARKVILTYGANQPFPSCMEPMECKQYGEAHEHISNDITYMYESMTRKVTSLSNLATYVSKCIMQKENLQWPELRYQDDFSGDLFYGRVISEKKHNVDVLQLEIPRGDFSSGVALTMNLSQLKTYSIFPGQTVVAKGTVLKGALTVDQLYTGLNQSPPNKTDLTESVQIIVASGPFTTRDNLAFEPLQDLLKYVLEKLPHFLILLGPFLDVENEHVESMTEDFEVFFNTLVESIMAPLEGTPTTVVFVSSHKDVHHQFIYPTPPYELRQKYPNLLCMPDPCILDINGLLIGATSTDILFHIGKKEKCFPMGLGDRMSRLSQHILNQLSFYPLYPPESTMAIDHELLEKFGVFDTIPHVLLLPSVFKHFVKNVNGCTVVNPERLVKGYSGGTFARLAVHNKAGLNISCEILQV